MNKTNFEELLDAGVHFGHLKRKWNPAMAPYIFMERNGIHIIDLNKTLVKLDEAARALQQIAKSGKKILFVATKKQAKEIVSENAKSANMPYITERWSGGMLTNFPTVRKAIKKMISIDKMATDGTFENISKRERLQVTRQRIKLESVLGSIAEMNKLPAALFVVDVLKEKIAVAEAKRLHIPVFGIVDTNSNPSIDFPIPANDDASKSIKIIVEYITSAINDGLTERKATRDQDKKASDSETTKAPVKRARKTRARKTDSDFENKTEEQSDNKIEDKVE
ncbi:MAG: 30S ribosomal protein S2 [Bacteroidales bacterium]|nr:30S ribosomal protein S2 [Bacteroidales bacterium]MBN2757866.1 30S ribosomal protein S2 [Bacteroidales bacterium]